MGEVSTHTFEKGMNQDLVKSRIDNQTAFEIRNFRLNTSDGDSTTALENIEGTCSAFADLTETGVVVAGDYVVVATSVIYDLTTYWRGDVVTADGIEGFTGTVINQLYMIEVGHDVIGSINMRNQVVLYSTDNTGAAPSGGNSCIYKATMATDDEDGRFASFERIYDDDVNGVTDLNFSSANPITGVGRYETSDIVKVYWVDSYNNIRYCNIENYLTTDGLVKTGGNLYFPVDRFEFIPNSVLPKATLTDIVSGDIDAGLVQYTYQMYINHGAETAFAPLSNVIHVARSDDFLTNSNDYRGGEYEEQVGKGFKITIDNSGNSGFNRIRIIALHRKSINDIPTIRIATELGIDQDTNSISYVDTGNAVGELTLEQLAIFDTNLFKAAALENKADLLFASNIEMNPFEVSDWDARTYRFNSDEKAFLYEADDSYFKIYNTGVTRDGAGGAATLGDWEYFSDGDAYQNTHDDYDEAGYGTAWGIPETADCINNFNDPDNEPVGHVNKFQADGTTLGSQGKNLKIGFDTENFDIDTLGSTDYAGVGTESVADNESYKDYASPWRAGQERSWQRDEVYRMGFVFYDDKMRKSQAMWTVDLKFPYFNEEGADTYDLIVTGAPVEAMMLHPKVYLTSVPTNAEYYQVCRVQRGRTDRSVLAQGLINKVSGTGRPTESNSTTADADDVIKLISPEPIINQNIAARSGDYIEYIGNWGAGANVPVRTGDSGTDNEVTFNVIEFNPVVKAAVNKIDIDNVAILPPSTDTITLGGNVVINHTGGPYNAYGGTALFIEVLPADISAWAGSEVQWCAVNYRRNVFNSQYGGNTYEARTQNEYIPASDLENTEDAYVDCKIGDTFITYFEYLNCIWDLAQDLDNPEGGDTDSLHEVLFIPVESSINCNLRHDLGHSNTHGSSNNELLQEFAGTHVDLGDNSFLQETDLYQYNSIYSEENDIVKFFALPYDYTAVNEYDCRVKVSENKTNGELTDSWTKFNANEYIDVDTRFGSINNLHLFKDHLMFYQDTSFGILSVNERSLISDNNPGELVLGTGDVLSRYNYISKNIGNNHLLGLVESANSLYWFYDNEKAMYKYSPQQKEMPLSKLKGMQSWFNENFSNEDSVIGVYDDKYNEVLFTLGGSDTIVYNEMFDIYSAFYDFVPGIYIKLNNDRFISSSDSYWLFYHNFDSDGYRCLFYNAVVPVHSTVKFIVSDYYSQTKVFDIINYASIAYYDSKNKYSSTFNRFRGFTDYQNTSYVTLTPGTNLERRERSWSFAIPRDIVDVKEETDSDIFLAGNLDDAQTFKKRMRDKWMQVELDYYNTDHYKFVVPYVNTKYRLSYR